MRAPTAKLQLLETTDLHMQILPYDYFSDQAAPATGLRQLSLIIDHIRDSGVTTLLFDNGDFLQGNPSADVAFETADLNLIHPMIAAMNKLQYDAVNLGNHEFNFGLRFLRDTLAHADFPILCGNVVERNETIAEQSLIIERKVLCDDGITRRLRLGVLGCVTPQITQWDHEVLQGAVDALDIVETAQTVARRLRDEGADLVLALCHSGLGADDHVPGQENAIIPVAKLPEIDVVMAGHTHIRFPNADRPDTELLNHSSGYIAGKPVVQAGFNGSHLGQINLDLDYENNRWVVSSSESILHKTPEAAIDSATAGAIDELVAEHHKSTLHNIRQPIARTLVPINSHFSMVAGDIGLQLLAQAQLASLKDKLLEKSNDTIPIVSAVSPFMSGGRAGSQHYIDIADGQLARKDVAAIYPFANTIYGIELSGADLRTWMERSAAAFQTIEPNDRPQALLNPDMASYNYDIFYGLDYRLDLSHSKERITSIRFEGREITDTDQVIVATNSYRARGGGGHLRGIAPSLVYCSQEPVRSALLAHLRSANTIDQQLISPWKFEPISHARPRFLTAAKADATQVTSRKILSTGRTENGFAEFELVL